MTHSRRWIALGVALVLVVTTVLVAGAVTTTAARNRITSALRAALPGSDVDVRIGGYVPVQLARGELADVRVEIRDAVVPAVGRELRVGLLTARAQGVSTASPTTIRRVDGAASVSWAEISRVTGAQLTAGPDGSIEVSAPMSMLGERFTVVVRGAPQVDVGSQQLRLAQPSATVDEIDVPDDVVSGVLKQVSSRYSLPQIPGVTWTGVTCDENGFVLSFSASDVQVRT